MRLLLLSNSRNPGGGWLEHAGDEIQDFLGEVSGKLIFFPFAGVSLDFDAYTAMARRRFREMGYALQGAHKLRCSAAGRAAGFVVGGGNTFRLLHEMQRRGWLDAVRRRVRAGVPYIGWSAGTILMCPTIRTTNDMPIIEPASLKAFGLLPFQINAHYTERTLAKFGGETRDQRLAEFQALNPGVPVLGLREGSLLRLEGKKLSLRLGPGAELFARRKKAFKAGADLSFLLK
jgi:dipeptidase E